VKRSDRFAAQLAARKGQTLGAFGALIDLEVDSGLVERLGVVPAVPSSGTTLCGDDFGAIERPLLDACEDDADTIPDLESPWGFFFESGAL
jgi:hypothetical protein